MNQQNRGIRVRDVECFEIHRVHWVSNKNDPLREQHHQRQKYVHSPASRTMTGKIEGAEKMTEEDAKSLTCAVEP